MRDIDYSKFKKISQEKGLVMLEHPDGHTIKIASSGLSPMMRKKLEALPLHAAEGTKVETIEKQTPDENEVETIKETPEDMVAVEKNEDLEAKKALEQPAPAPPVAPVAPVAAAPAVAPVPAQASTGGVPDAPEVPMGPAQNATLPAFPSEKARVPEVAPSTDESPQEHYAKELAFQQDLANRHIEPKTYQSMFANKSTLGKVGTIFGLMLAGAGSGLTGQPNALLDMMNKEIDRDLDAQKTSKSNANTFLKTQYDHDLQQAQMLKLSNENALTQKQIEKLDKETAGLGQANKAVNKQVTTKAGGKWDESLENGTIGTDLSAKNKMLSTAVQHLDDMSANNPQAKALIQNVIRPAVDAQIQQNVVKIGQMKTKAAKEKAAQQVEQADNEIVDMNKYRKMIDSGNFNKQHNIPMNSKRDIDPADDARIQEAVAQKTKIANNYKDVMEAYNALASMPNAGQAPITAISDTVKKLPFVGESLAGALKIGQGKLERPRDQLIDALSQRLSANGASAETMEMMKKALSPTMFDTPQTLAKGAELVHQHFEHSPEFHPGVLQKYGLDKPLPKARFDAKKAEEASKKSGGFEIKPYEIKFGSDDKSPKEEPKKEKSFFEKAAEYIDPGRSKK